MKKIKINYFSLFFIVLLLISFTFATANVSFAAPQDMNETRIWDIFGISTNDTNSATGIIDLSSPLIQIIAIIFVLFILALVGINVIRKQKEKKTMQKNKLIEKERILKNLKEDLK